MDIIPHYGKWQAQLQLVNDGDVYTSKPFDFSIVNDLSNLAPQPTLTDINNWSTLKQSANELIDEMQDIIVDVENSESGRVNKENLRQQAESERVNQERTRQNNDLKRENQENKRQQAESERENNEKQRRSAEFERVNKETARQQAESQRTTAESIRVSDEEQRKIDHENRSAELAGKANKKQEDWRTPTMVNGATGSLQYRKDEFGIVRFKGDINAPATSGFTQLVSLPASHGIYESRYLPVSLNTYTASTMQTLRFTNIGIFINRREANTYNLDNTYYSTD